MYKDFDDQELVYLIGENNEAANNILYKKYERLISLKSKKYLNLAKRYGLEYNDIFQEGMVGLSEAIRCYKEQKETKFSSFANLCIDRQIYSTLSKASRKKHTLLNESFSLDFTIEEDGKPLMEFLFDKNSDPSIKFENEENRKSLMEYLNANLTDLEKNVLNLRLNGFEYKEISVLLNKSYKSIDSSLQRVRLKLKEYITKE